jgi:outer membrane protein, multidrug efflux system
VKSPVFVARAAAIASVLTVFGLVAGCAVGPDYTPPSREAHGSFHAIGQEQQGPSKVSGAGADHAEWWKRFGDPTLDSLVERAVSSNLDLRLAESRLREARAQRGIVAADRLPTVTGEGGYTRSRGSDTTNEGFGRQQSSDGVDLCRAGFDASWELDFFGRVRRSVEAADADVGAAAEERRDVLVSLLAELASNYVEFRGFQRRIEVVERTIQTEIETVELVSARFKAGLTTELDVAQAQAQLATRQSQRPPLRIGLKRASHRIAVLLGQEPGSLLEELGSSAMIPVPPGEVAVGAPADLLRRRPDIRRAERQIAASTARVGVATADLYPRFTLLGSFGFESGQVGDLVDMNSRVWSIGPGFSVPVFNAGRLRSAVKVRDEQLDQSLTTYERTVLTAFEEVENALVAYVQEQIRRQSLAEAVASNERAVSLSKERYQSGVVDFLNVLDSQRLLYQSQDQLVESDQQVTGNLVALYKSLGGGWRDEPAAQAPADPESPEPAQAGTEARPLKTSGEAP